MALPKLNELPNFELTIPSTRQNVRFRPYLVKEEKVMMMAFESGDVRTALKSIVDTLKVCIEGDNVNFDKLTTFDVEYMFTQVRAKSVGETSTIYIKCKDCKHVNEREVNLEQVDMNVEKGTGMIPLTDTITLEMQYPSYLSVLNNDVENLENVETAFKMIASCIVAVHNDEERVDVSNESPEEINAFIESLTSSQFQSVVKFFETIPKMKKDISFNCSECGVLNEMTLEGMSDFF